MFNIFQYEKINKTRLDHKKTEEKLEQAKQMHDKKTLTLSSSANMRRLEWAAKFLESDMRNSKIHVVLQEGSIKLLNSSILECRKDSSSEDSESEVKSSQIKKIIHKMDTKILHPYTMTNNVHSPDFPISETSKVLKTPEKSQADHKKPFNPYSRSYKKDESAWQYYQSTYPSIPSNPSIQNSLSHRMIHLKDSFKLGVKSDLWNSLIKPRESIRSYQSNKNLHNLPDSKLYKKSLEHLISRKLN